MFKRVSPSAKARIVAAWAQAITGNTAGALSLLGVVTTDPNDSAAFAVARAHLLHLEGKNLEALEILEGDIRHLSDQLAEETNYVIGTNRNTLRLALQDFTAIRDHYKAEDVKRQSRREEGSLKRLVQADEAAARNEHREALPLYWANLLDAYEDGTWARLRAAHQRLSRECWILGWFAEATFHAVSSLNKDAVTFVAAQALASRDLSVITETLRPVLRTTNLLEHRSMAAVIVQTLHDVIPDNMFGAILEWAETGIDYPVETEHVAESIGSLWRAVAAIAPRFSSQQAHTIVAKALNHPDYTKFILQRRYVIAVLQTSFSKLGLEMMTKVAEACVALLGPQRHVIDYGLALNLAATIANKAPLSVTALLADAVLPRESGISDLRLAALVPLLDRKPTLDRLATIVDAVPAKVRRQVQRLKNNEEPDANLSFMAMMKESKDGNAVVVFLHGAAIELDAVLALKRWLTPEQARSVVEAVLDMVRDSANIPANRVYLLQRLAQLADVVDVQTSQLMFEQLEGLLLADTPATEAADQLSPFTMNLGSAEEESGWALYCAGTVAAKHSGLLGLRLLPHLEKGFVSACPEVRSAAVAVVGELPSASTSLISRLISAAGDSSPNVAISAFAALVQRSALALNETQWQFLAGAIRSGLLHTSSAVRRAAAGSIRCLKTAPLAPEQVNTIRELTSLVQADLSFVVRESLCMEVQRDALNDSRNAITGVEGECK